MKIAITAESTIDLPAALLDEFDIRVIPFTVILGEEAKKDGEVGAQDIYDYFKRTKKTPHTAALNENEYADFFAATLRDYDAIVHFCLSSGVSSTHEHAVRAAEAFAGRVTVVDSLSLSSGEAMIAIYMRRLLRAGYSLEEALATTRGRIPHLCSSFCFENVNYLHRGGRCSGVAAFGANLLRIRPQIIMPNGKMEPHKKFRGPAERWVRDYVNATLEEFNHPDLDVAFVTEATIAPEVVEGVIKTLRDRGFRTIYHAHPQATISAHVGPSVLGIFYFNDGDHPILPRRE